MKFLRNNKTFGSFIYRNSLFVFYIHTFKIIFKTKDELLTSLVAIKKSTYQQIYGIEKKITIIVQITETKINLESNLILGQILELGIYI